MDGRMVRRLVAIIAVLALCATVLAGPGLAGNGNGEAKSSGTGNSSATVWVDFDYGEITSTKGISHYVVEFTDGGQVKVELSGDDQIVYLDDYDLATVASVKVKSGTTYETFEYPGDTGDGSRPDYCDDPELDAWPPECW